MRAELVLARAMKRWLLCLRVRACKRATQHSHISGATQVVGARIIKFFLKKIFFNFCV